MMIEHNNVALNKLATQSSTCEWSRQKVPQVDARGAVKGYITGSFGFHTDFEMNPWWAVDLEQLHVISRIVIYNRLDAPERLRHFTVLHSVDRLRWGLLFEKTDDSIFGRGEDDPLIINISNPTIMRMILVRLSGEGWLHFDELQAFGYVPDVMTQAALAAQQRFGPSLRVIGRGAVTVPWRARRKREGMA
jgi:hypothetical protein